jgi:hypothetical protein
MNTTWYLHSRVPARASPDAYRHSQWTWRRPLHRFNLQPTSPIRKETRALEHASGTDAVYVKF